MGSTARQVVRQKGQPIRHRHQLPTHVWRQRMGGGRIERRRRDGSHQCIDGFVSERSDQHGVLCHRRGDLHAPVIPAAVLAGSGRRIGQRARPIHTNRRYRPFIRGEPRLHLGLHPATPHAWFAPQDKRLPLSHARRQRIAERLPTYVTVKETVRRHGGLIDHAEPFLRYRAGSASWPNHTWE